MKESPKQIFTITNIAGEPNAARYLGLQDKIRNRIASRQQKAAYEAAQAANGPAPRGGIGSTVAAIGVAMAAMGLASLSSLDDVGKK